MTVLSGDIVQATESGAGCGDNWPRCDGSLLPGMEDAATAIEFTHRMLTVLLTCVICALIVGAFRVFPKGHRVRASAVWVGATLVLEVAIGAALVLFGWVGEDASIGRVIADALHVINTFFLIGAGVLVVYFVLGGNVSRPAWSRRPDRELFIVAVVILLISVSGAINSLADALFPLDSVLGELSEEFGSTVPFLVRMRIAHPAIAIVGGVAIFLLVRNISMTIPLIARAGTVVLLTIVFQFVSGILNIAFLTPLETQVVHLLLADVLWMSFLYLAFRCLDPGAMDPLPGRGCFSEAAT